MLNAVEGHKPAVDGAELGKWTQDYDAALELASEKKLPLLLNFTGSDWCGWCKLYDKFSNSDEDIALIMMQEYTTVLVNWSPENRNLEAMNYLGTPQRFGYPVFIILDGNGNVLHTQDTALLEEGRGYNKNHVLRFLKVWTYSAVNEKIK